MRVVSVGTGPRLGVLSSEHRDDARSSAALRAGGRRPADTLPVTRIDAVERPAGLGWAPCDNPERARRPDRLERATTPGPARPADQRETPEHPPDMAVETSTWATKKGLAQMLKGGVIMDVVTPDHAKIAQDAGAVAVMALERVPADIRAAGGVARMSDPSMIEGIMRAVTIPVMAKARIGHFVEAQVLEALGVDYIDESEVLTPADETNHIDKHAFKVPFVCGCRNLGEALRRINEGAAMMRTKGEAGTGNVVEAVRQLRDVLGEIRKLQGMREDELFVAAKELQAPYELVKQVAADGRLPVVNFVAGGISTPADAALVMQLGSEGVFVGSGIFKSEDPARMANAIVQATTHFDNPKIIADVSKGLGAPMRGIAMEAIPEGERLAVRGW
jgi:pyridoxal 5'-phosphate synthase pdxS subunit